uniref:Akirin n=1 Tax=Ditylenchus dipsaci TaxID=166011 RepID=A0A915D395_9BILA
MGALKVIEVPRSCPLRDEWLSRGLQTPLLSKGRVKRRPAYLIEETNMPSPKLAKKENSRGHRNFAEPSPSKVQSLVAKVIRTHQNSNGMIPNEVTRGTEKEKKRIAELYKQTKPIMLELYERIQAEYALYETSRRLDITDDKFVRNDLVG